MPASVRSAFASRCCARDTPKPGDSGSIVVDKASGVDCRPAFRRRQWWQRVQSDRRRDQGSRLQVRKALMTPKSKKPPAPKRKEARQSLRTEVSQTQATEVSRKNAERLRKQGAHAIVRQGGARRPPDRGVRSRGLQGHIAVEGVATVKGKKVDVPVKAKKAPRYQTGEDVTRVHARGRPMPIVVKSVAGQPQALADAERCSSPSSCRGTASSRHTRRNRPVFPNQRRRGRVRVTGLDVRGDQAAVRRGEEINRDRHLRLHRRSHQAAAGCGDESRREGRADARSRWQEGRGRVRRPRNARRRLHAGAVVRQPAEQQVLSFVA